MKILAIDTSCMTASCAVSENGRILGEISTHHAKTHAQQLVPMMDMLLGSLAFDISDMDAFAVAIGPGSFTGLRIGVVTMKGLAYATGKPVIGIKTLDALAKTVPAFNGMICPVLDARNHQVFTAFYKWEEKSLHKKSEDEGLTVDEMVSKIISYQQDVLLVGDAADKFAPLLEDALEVVLVSMAEIAPIKIYTADSGLYTPRAATVALLAEKRLESGDIDDVHTLVPFYLRPSQAERMKRQG